jgi:hypothetical protein
MVDAAIVPFGIPFFFSIRKIDFPPASNAKPDVLVFNVFQCEEKLGAGHDNECSG